MKIKFISHWLFILSLAVLSSQGFAIRVGDLEYQIISDENKTVNVSIARTAPQIYDLVIPSSVEIDGEEYQVVAVKERGFYYTKKIYNTIEVPPSVKIIGKNAFSGIQNVNEIILHEGLDSIGDEAFMSSSIKRIEIPISIKILTNKAFAGLKNVEEIVLHEGLSSIGKGVFYNSSLPNSIEIPTSVKTIGDNAFSGIKNVNEIILHEGLDSIGNDAFSTSSIKKIDLPSTVTKLGSDIFHSSDLQEIEWPKNLHKIPDGCFMFTKLNRFDFTHIKEIGWSAFDGCSSLDNVTIPSGCYINKFAFQGCGLKNLTFDELPPEMPLSPEYQTYLDEFSFSAAANLNRLVLPRGLLIYLHAFMSCEKVKTIEIHEGVKFAHHNVFVGDEAYDGHDHFIGYSDNWIPDSIIYLTANPEKTYDIFQDVMYERSTLYVKPEALEKVRNTYPWSKFRKIEVLSSGIDDIPADTDDGQNGPNLFYNLEGIPCGSDRNALAPGIYILRKNGKTSKIVI